MSTRNHYQLLGVEPNASRSAIRVAYRKALRRHHPDTNAGNREGEELLRRVIAAGRVLCDPRRREDYDRGLKPREIPSSVPQPRAPIRPLCGPYHNILLGCRRVLTQGRNIWRTFLNAEWARATEVRAAQQRGPKPPNFNAYLYRAINSNSTGQYTRGNDGIYRRSERRSKQKQPQAWQKRTVLWLLMGILLWRV